MSPLASLPSLLKAAHAQQRPGRLHGSAVGRVRSDDDDDDDVPSVQLGELSAGRATSQLA